MRTVILVLALGFIAVLAFLTLFVLFTSGPDVLVVLSLLVLGLFAFGVIGALSTPPREVIRRLALMLLIVAAGAGGAALLAHRGATEPRARRTPRRSRPGSAGWARRRRRSRCGSTSRATRSASRFDRPPRGGAAVRRRHRPRAVAARADARAADRLADEDDDRAARRRARAARGRVRITPEALRYQGSGVGLLPRGKLIGVETMLHGLLLSSGNDAAIALAQRAAGGSEPRFVRLMNERARAMGLACTRFSTPSGIRDAGNHSCAGDLAALARAVLRQPRLRADRRAGARRSSRSRSRAASSTSTTPTRCCGRGYRGTTGREDRLHGRRRALPRGHRAARHRSRLGVVLLDSPDPGRQAHAAAGPRLRRQPLSPRATYSVGGEMAPDRPDRAGRKADHLRIAAEPGVEHAVGAGLDAGAAPPPGAARARPRRRRACDCELLGARLGAPLVISAMTGGTAEAAASSTAGSPRAAAEHGIGLVLGSGRALLDDPALLPTYRPAGGPRPPLLLANLGAAQVRGPGRARARRAARRAARRRRAVRSTSTPCRRRSSPRASRTSPACWTGSRRSSPGSRRGPVVVKEVGFGLDPEDVRAARRAPGVAAVDVAGAGGTNWALIEGRRDPRAGAVAAAFADWGVPTARRAGRRAGGGARAAGDRLRRRCATASTSRSASRSARPRGGLARPFLIAAQADRAGEAVRHGDRAAARSRRGRPARRPSAALGEEHLR